MYKIDNLPNGAAGNTVKAASIIAIQLCSLAKHCSANLAISYNVYEVEQQCDIS